MRSATTFLIVALLAFSGVLPVAAQSNAVRRAPAKASSERSEKPQPQPPARTTKSGQIEPGIRFAAVEAYSDGSGAFIRWSMEREAGNLGFSVYRIDPNGKTLINQSLIAGSALQVNDQVLSGTQYRYFDPAGVTGSLYIVESILTNGFRFDSPAVSAAYVRDLAAVRNAEQSRRSEAFVSANDGQALRLSMPKDIQLAVESGIVAPDPEMQKWVVRQPGVRIAVRKDGMYRVTEQELSDAGFDTEQDPANWQLYKDGVEQAIIVGPEAAYIEFYGKGLDRIETDEQMYFLVNGPSPGKRIGTRVIRRVGAGVTTSNYEVSLNKKERTSYVNGILNGPLDNFWGRVVFSTATTIPVDVTGIDRSRPEVALTIFMQGYSIAAHSISVKFNGTSIGTIDGFGRAAYSKTFTFPTSLLLDGSNGVTLQSSGTADTNLFDQFTLDYSRKFVAANGQISFYTQAYRGIKLEGFSSPDVRLLDMTLDGNPQLLTGLEFEEDNGSYSAHMPAYRPRTIYAFEDSALLTPASISSYDTAPLSDPDDEGQLIIIAYKDFLGEAETWANYRRGQGFTVKVVNVDEIYDEFNYGAAGASGVTAYLHYAYDNWETPPSYVLLIGDASYDPRGYEGIGRFNLVPTKFVNTIFSETGSDEALADFNNDGFAEIAIGRIPARTVGVATHALNKVMSFEVPAMQDLSRGVLMAHDLNDGWDFDQMSVRVASELPEGTPITYVSRASPTAQADVIANINEAKYLVNYTGHGSSGAWAAVSFFSVLNEPQLTNTDQSLFTMLTCLNGYFVGNQNDSFSEVLVKSDHGAVAAWASAGLTTPDVQEVMAKRFFNQIGRGDITRLGDLIKDAKSVIPGGTDVRLSWALIGDPMLKVR